MARFHTLALLLALAIPVPAVAQVSSFGHEPQRLSRELSPEELQWLGEHPETLRSMRASGEDLAKFRENYDHLTPEQKAKAREGADDFLRASPAARSQTSSSAKSGNTRDLKLRQTGTSLGDRAA